MFKYKQKLAPEVEAQLDAYIERIKLIKWFKPSKDLKRETVDTLAEFALKTFGLKAPVEYRHLKTQTDWSEAREAAWDARRDPAWEAAEGAMDAVWDAAWGCAAMGAAWIAVTGAAREAAMEAAREAAMSAAWKAAVDAGTEATWGTAYDPAWEAAKDTAWDAAWGCAAMGAADLLTLSLDSYKAKYPDGNFINLIPLLELGLSPVGVIGGKFIIYIPPSEDQEFPGDLL